MTAPRTHSAFAILTGRPRIQTQWVWGRNERRRWAVFAVKFGIFLGLPWVTVGGMPALLFDVPARRFHVFGQVFWPQDMYVLGLAMAVAALLLFATSALVGRVFCGYACPHTLLTSLFMLIDHHVEGDRPVRLALDAGTAPWPRKLRRVAKHAIWVAVSLGLGATFVSYFVGARSLWPALFTLSASTGSLIGIGLVAGVTYLFAGHLRDMICTLNCPYGRFQGAMQDPDSLVVTYDMARGEPRGKGAAVIARGGCVDCGACVTACPVGIDIRNGPQYECITCARCIDACDATMAKLGAPPDLIKLAALAHTRPATPLTATAPLTAAAPAPAHGAAPLTANAPAASPARAVENPDALAAPMRENRRWRPRLGWYALVLAALLGTIATLVIHRPLVALDVVRDANTALTLPDGRVSNLYVLKLLNKDTRPHRLAISLDGLDGQLVGTEALAPLAPGEIRQVRASVVLPRRPDGPPKAFRFRVTDTETQALRGDVPATFVAPS